MPRRATTKPVLQMSTNTAGIARTNAACAPSVAVEETGDDIDRLSPIQTEMLFASTGMRGIALPSEYRTRPHVGQERERNNERNQDPVRFASGIHRTGASHARCVHRGAAAAPRPAGRR